ncbi:hypothetical protein GCM10011410_16400 [Hoyosella rhizosphaerae]|uniref:Cell envelope-related transcriptional attenuator domain-containing protein n=1 Tax=Hoyosella rhizosphaerae TaxID=1755582 RepID=A0A916XDU4_9ACTN|nr:hypothetical protein GCM10011410_16400 [Hoyosella rhizosphaerae]
MIVGVAAFGIDRMITRIDATQDYAGRIGATPGTNYLLVGTDSREGLTPEQQQELATGGDTGPIRTDTIMLLHVPSGGDPVLVSIPRDSYIPIPGHGQDKVNISYAIGGAPLLVRTIEEATGVRIDRYVEIGFTGFADITEAIGGVEMCLDAPIFDPLAGIELESGCQKLSGREALGFVRTRATPRADLDRMNNQRQFMSALAEKATRPSTILNPLRSIPLARAVGRTVTVDRDDHLWNLALLGWALRGETPTATVPVGGFGDVPGSGNVVYWDANAAPRFWAAIARGEPIPSELMRHGW